MTSFGIEWETQAFIIHNPQYETNDGTRLWSETVINNSDEKWNIAAEIWENNAGSDDVDLCTHNLEVRIGEFYGPKTAFNTHAFTKACKNFMIFWNDVIDNKKLFSDKLFELEILREDDSIEEVNYFTDMFYDLLSLFTKPFQNEYFDFSDADFFNNIAQLGERFAKDTNLRKMNGNRGSKHFIYMNRTFFGLYNLMFDLKAKIKVNEYLKY